MKFLRGKRLPLVLALIATILGAAGLQANMPRAVRDPSQMIEPDRAEYILYGNKRGGGHKYGTGRACKTEFPKDWDDEKILTTVANIAANDNLDWHKEGNGYTVTEHVVDGVRVRVILGNRGTVVTAYPKNMPRNPCPANDNQADD